MSGVEPGCEPGCEPGPERDRRALVERVCRAWLSAPRRDEFDIGASGEAVLALLESGLAGVHLLAGADLQASIGVVLAQRNEALDRLREALTEVGRLVAGADFSAAEPGVEPSAGQVYGVLLSMSGPVRISALRRLLDSAHEGSRCFQMDHAERLCVLEGQAERWRALVEAVVADGLVRCLNPDDRLGEVLRCGECSGCAMRAAVAAVAP